MKRTVAAAVALTVMSAVTAAAANAADIVRYPLGGGSTFPIARAVEVPAGFKLVFHSGFTPAPADPKAKEGTPAYWGDTKTQALSALTRMQDSLKEMGLGFGDVVKMTVFLVGDPATGRMDFKGFMEAYTQFFGTKEQPNLPARSAVQVAGLAGPGMLVEIEVVLAQSSTSKKKP
jgi:enamine deaminase RidA (YjgF/YER057c/UK114 family)